MKNPENKYAAEKNRTDLDSMELKANLNPQQRKHLEVLKSKMKKVLGGKAKQELAKAGDLASLKKYKAILGEILQFLKTKEIKENKALLFKTMEELKAVYSPEQIAHNKDEVNEETKVYIGEFYPGIFKELPRNIDHIYTSFPEGKITIKEIIVGGKTIEQLKTELKDNGFNISNLAKKMMDSEDFKSEKKEHKLTLVIVPIKALGLLKEVSRKNIYNQAQKFGLELVPSEVGPQLRLQNEDQHWTEWWIIGSEPLSVSTGETSVFSIGRNFDGSWLHDAMAIQRMTGIVMTFGS